MVLRRPEIIYSNQESVILKNGKLKLPQTKQTLNIGKIAHLGKLKQVRVIPNHQLFVVEIVLEIPKQEISHVPNNERYLSIDLGVNNLATMLTNTGEKPILIKGNVLKSINQYYNKMKAHYYSILRHGKNTNQGTFTSKRLERLHLKRWNKIKDYFHKVSYHITQYAKTHNICEVIIGQNTSWKQELNLGKRNNQSFCHIPHSLLIQILKYKLFQEGIKLTEIGRAHV